MASESVVTCAERVGIDNCVEIRSATFAGGSVRDAWYPHAVIEESLPESRDFPISLESGFSMAVSRSVLGNLGML